MARRHAVRSARREDLIRILAPAQRLPVLDLLRAYCSVEERPAVESVYRDQTPSDRRDAHLAWNFLLDFYVTPATETLALPVHRVRMEARQGTERERVATELRFGVPTTFTGSGAHRDSHTIVTTRSEAIVDGPARLNLSGSFFETPREVNGDDVTLVYSIIPAGFDRPLTGTVTLARDLTDTRRTTWKFETPPELDWQTSSAPTIASWGYMRGYK